MIEGMIRIVSEAHASSEVEKWKGKTEGQIYPVSFGYTLSAFFGLSMAFPGSILQSPFGGLAPFHLCYSSKEGKKNKNTAQNFLLGSNDKQISQTNSFRGVEIWEKQSCYAFYMILPLIE